jgi:hypothetical protein
VPVTPGVQTTTDVDNCEAKYFQPLCASLASFVIHLSTLSGSTSIFVSRSVSQPSQFLYDFNDQSNSSLKTIQVDRTSNTSLFIAVQGTGGNSTGSNVFSLQVSADVFSGLRSVSATIREDASSGAVVYSMAPLITELGFTVSFNYSILNGSSGLFSIHPSNGAITTRGSLIGLAGRSYGLFISANSPIVTCLSGVLLLNITVLTANYQPPSFVSLTAASIRQDALPGTVVIVARAVTAQPNAVLQYALSPTAVCTSQFYQVTGTFAYFGATRSRANCIFWASQTGAVADYSCTWHGCLAPATVLSSTTVLCSAPDWNLLPPGASASTIRVSVRVFADTTVSPSSNQCFSTAGTGPMQWAANNYVNISLTQACPTNTPPAAAATPTTLPSLECSTSTRPTLSAVTCLTSVPAGCPPPFAVNATTGAVVLTSEFPSLPTGPIPILVTVTQSLAADPTRLLFAQQGIAITVVPVACPAGSFSSNGFLPCTPCTAGTFASAPGATTCQPCGCSGNTFRSGSCSTTTNVQCLPCPINSVTAADFSTCNCLPSFFRAANGSCFPCSSCSSSQYQLTACSALSNTVCLSTRICQAGLEFETAAPTLTSNRDCRTCRTNCPAGTQPDPAFPCGPFADRQCTPCADGTFKLTTTLESCTPCTTRCGSGQFISGQCTSQSSPVCTNCTSSCPADSYLTGTCGGSSNPTCTPCVTCTPGLEYETTACTLTSNRACAACTQSCPTGQYLSGTCSAQSSPTCLFCTQASSCASNQFLAGICSGSFNTFCSNCAASCRTCATNALQCTSCNAGTFLKGLSCVSNCGTSMFGDNTTGLCAECAVSCLTCTSPSPSSCLTCPIGLFLSQGQCIASCPAGSYGLTSNRQCTPCSSCATGQFRTGGCSGSTNTQCRPFTACNTSSFESAAPTSSTDRVCTLCRNTCPAGTQLANTCNGLVDNSCTPCSTGTFQATASSLACAACTNSCPAGQFLTGTCTATSDRTCSPCSLPGACARNNFLAGTCTSTSNPTCQPCLVCAANEFETSPCTDSSNRACSTCTQACPTGQFLSGSCSATSNPTCQACSSCNASQFVATPCSPTSNTVCAACQSQCATCRNDASCQTCAGSLVLQNSNCVSNCTSGFFVDGSNTCQPCATGCAVCTGPSTASCVKCPGSEFLLASGACASFCPLGTYGDVAAGRCVACSSCNAATQFQTRACSGTQNTECAPLRQCNSSSFQSVAPTATSNRECALCTASCPVGQQLQGSCGGSSNPTCMPCPGGQFKPDASGNACSACTTSCPSDFFLTGSCTSSTSPVCLPCTSSCPTPFYLNGTCSLTTNRQCLACTTCLSGQYETAPCTATSNRQCSSCTTSCSAGSFLSGTCSGTINTACTPCTTSSACSASQYLSGQCTLSTNTQCVSCSECAGTEYQVQACTATSNRQCQACPTAASCAAGQYLVGSCPGSITAAFPSTVVINGQSFAVLDRTAASSTVSSCQSGLLTIPAGWQIAADEADSIAAITGNPWGTACVAVASGRAYQANTGAACPACPGTNCTNVVGSAAGVTTCNLRILVSSTPPSCRSCVNSCPRDQFLTGTCGGTSTTFCQQCTPCAAGFYESSPCTASSDRVCLACTEDSQCATGTFLKGTCSSTSNPVCTACTSSCEPGFHLQGSCGGTVDRTCAACATCTSSQYQVSACQATAPTDNTVCANCTSSCSANQYLQNTCTLFSNPVCVNCLTAAQCNVGTYLQGPCTLTNPTTCAPCHGSCQSCSGPNSDQCTACSAPLTLVISSGQQGVCASQCPPGSFKDPFLNRCVGCDDACATCNNYGAAACLSCPTASPYLTSASVCVSNCSTGLWNDNSTGFPRCSPCSSCPTGFYVSGACGGAVNTPCSPVQVCQPGFFTSASNTATSDRVCSPCPANQYQPSAGASACVLADPCVLGSTFQTQDVTPVANRVCSPVTACSSATQFLITPATLLADNVCGNLTVCTSNEYQSTPPTATSNRVCSTVSLCDFTYQYIKTAATATTNTVCANLTVCVAGEQIVVPATTVTDLSCASCPVGTSDVDSAPSTPCVACGPGSFVPARSTGSCAAFACPAGTADADQSPATACTACPPDTFASTAGLSTCAPVAQCPAGSFASTAPTTSSNVLCSPCPSSTFKPNSGNLASCTPASTCGTGQYVKFAATTVTDTVCANVTVCESNQYIAVPATASSDAVCQDFNSCPVLTWISFPGNATTNRQCSSCRTCPASFFISTACGTSTDALCSLLRVCDAATEFQSAAPTTTSDRTCSTVTACNQSQYETAAPTATSDRQCAPLLVCNASTEFQSTAPTATSNRACSSLTVCGSQRFQSQAPTATSNRECQNIRQCSPPSTFQSIAATATSDAVCNQTRVCDPITEYELSVPTYTTDRVCQAQPLPVESPAISFFVAGSAYAVAQPVRTANGFNQAQWGLLPTGTFTASVGSISSSLMFSTAALPAVSAQCAIARQLDVYIEDPAVAVRFQLFDGNFGASPAATTVTFTVVAADGAVGPSASCVSSAGLCVGTVSVPLAWFGSQATASVRYTVGSGSSSTVNCPGTLSLQNSVANPAVARTVALVLPQSTLYRGDIFSAPIVVRSNQPITGFNLQVTFSAGVAFSSASADVSLWSVIVTPISSTTYLFTGQLQDPTYNPGLNQQLLSVSFSLLSLATSATETFQVTVVDLVNVLGQTVRPAGQSLPTAGNVISRTGVSTVGTVFIGSATQRTGLFASPSSGQVLNIGVASGVPSVISIATVAIQANGASLSQPSGLTCSLSVPSAGALSAACDSLTLATTGTLFSGLVSVTVSSGSLSSTFAVQVWAPSQYRLAVADSTLSRFTLSRALPCTPSYQTSSIFVGVTFQAGSSTSPELDFTSTLASLVSAADPAVVFLSSNPTLAVTGVSPGSTTLSLSSHLGATLATASVTVNNVLVFPTRLDAALVTGLDVSQTLTQDSASVYVGSASAVSGPLSADMQLAPVVVSAVLSDGVRMTLTPGDGVTLTSTNATAVTTTSQQQVQARGSSAGTLIDVNWVGSCAASFFSILRTSVSVQVSIPAIAGVRLSLGPKVTAVESPAALAPVNLPTALPIVVLVDYADNTTRDVTLDPRTTLSFTAGGSLVSLGGTQLVPAVVAGSTPGTATLQASYLGFTAQASCEVVTVTSLAVTPMSFPGLSLTQTTQINRVRSSPALYQSVAVISTLRLSDNTLFVVTSAAEVGVSGPATFTFDGGVPVVTPNLAGTVTVFVNFGSLTSTLVLTATNTLVTVTSLSALTVPSISGVMGTTAQASLTVSLSDGVILSGPAPLPGLISYSSANPLALTVSSTGLVTLLSNTPSPVTLTASVGALSTTIGVPCNLQPAVGDIDLGAVTGVQFSSPAVGSWFVVPVRVNVGSFHLGFVRFAVSFSNSLVLSSVSPPAGWSGGVFGVSGADVSVGPSAGASGIVTIAQLNFTVVGGAGSAVALSGRIIALQATDGSVIGGAVPRNFVAGSGTFTIAGGVRRRSVVVPCTNAPCAVCPSPRQTGDANGDCIFDGSDVLFSLQVLANLVTNPQFLTTLLPSQRVALDADGNGVVDLLDASLLNKASYGLIPFVSNVAVQSGDRPSCRLTVDADLLFKGDVLATANAAALFVIVEGSASILSASTLVQGSVAYSHPSFAGTIYSAAFIGSGHYSLSLALSASASFGVTLVAVASGPSDDDSRTLLLAGSSSSSSSLAFGAVSAVLTAASGVSANVTVGAHNALTTAVVTQSSLACHTLQCSPAGYITQPATNLLDTQCAPYRICQASEYESAAPTATSNRQCTTVINCNATQYETAAPTATSNRACAPLLVCAADVQYESVPPTATSNRGCLPVRTCTAAQYQTAPPTATSDRECSLLLVCTPGLKYQTVPATATSNRACADATVCDSTQYAQPDLTATSDRVCNNLTVCGPFEQETAPPTATSDRACAAIDYCDPNPCQNGGSCASLAGTYQCSCLPGFLGNDCEVVDYCNPNPCFNFGVCENSFSGPLCTCTDAHCGDCCADRADEETCPGGMLQECSRFSAQARSDSSSVPIGTIAGAVLGGFVGLILVMALAMYLLRRRGRSGEESFDKQPLAVYSMQNPGYGEMSPEDTLTPNFLRAVAYGMLRGRRLANTSDLDLRSVYQLLNLPFPATAVTTTLRQHAVDFLDTVIPLHPEVICDSLIEEAVNFVAEAMPDLLLEVALDVVAARAKMSSVTDDQIYEQYYAALEEAGVEYELVGDVNGAARVALYDALMEPDTMNQDYMDTGVEDYSADYALAGGMREGAEPTYSMAGGQGQPTEGSYFMAGGRGKPAEGTYAMASGNAAMYGIALNEASPYALAAGGPGADDEPVYSPANDIEPTYAFAGAKDGDADSDEATYSFAAAADTDGEPRYALGTVGGPRDSDEPTYSLAGGMPAESNDYDDPAEEANEPVYGAILLALLGWLFLVNACSLLLLLLLLLLSLFSLLLLLALLAFLYAHDLRRHVRGCRVNLAM